MWRLKKELIERVERFGDTSPGQFNLVADLLEIIAVNMDGSVHSQHDSIMLPTRMYEAADAMRQKAIDREAGGKQ